MFPEPLNLRRRNIAGRSAAWRGSFGGEPRQLFRPSLRRTSEAPPPRPRPISLVASLAILALIAAWLATVARWHNCSISADQSAGVTIYRAVADDSRMERVLRAFTLAVFVTAGLLGALEARPPRLPRGVAFVFAIMLMHCAIWCVLSYQPSDDWSALLSVTSPFVFTMCLGVFAGFDRSLWRPLRTVALGIAYGSVALGAYYTIQLTSRVVQSFNGSS